MIIHVQAIVLKAHHKWDQCMLFGLLLRKKLKIFSTFKKRHCIHCGTDNNLVIIHGFYLYTVTVNRSGFHNLNLL